MRFSREYNTSLDTAAAAAAAAINDDDKTFGGSRWSGS